MAKHVEAEAMRLEELVPALEDCGFSLSPLSGNTLALSAIPASRAAIGTPPDVPMC